MANNPVANLPPAPILIPNDPSYADRFNAWVVLARQAMIAYTAAYTAAMAQQGIQVRWEVQPGASPGSPVMLPPEWNAILTKDGVSSTVTVSIGRAQQVDPEALAAFDMQFNLKREAQLSSPQGSLPSTWFEPDYKPWVWNPEPYSVPGPTQTVTNTVTTIQPQQTPQNPDPGTIITAPSPTTTVKHTFWEWNYYYEQETGRKGPPPEAVGVADGNQMMTKAEWWAKVSSWYANAGTPPPGSGGGAGGGGGTGGGGGGSGDGGNGSGDGSGGGAGAAVDYSQMYILAGGLLLIILLAKR